MKIYILSRGPHLFSTERLVAEGIARGHEVRVLDYMQLSVLINADEPIMLYKGQPIEAPDAVIPRIGASKTVYGAAVVRQFEAMKVFSTVKAQSLVRSRDKLRSMQILSGHKVPVPITAVAADSSHIKSIIKQVGGPPIVIKLLEGTQGKGVVLAETLNAAKSSLDAFYGLKANFLVQEFIKEANGADIRVFIVNGKVVGSMMRQGTAGEFRSNLHQGGVAQRFKVGKAEREVAVAAAKALGLAVAGVDLIPSDRGPLVMEVNSSPGLEGIEGATKKNVAGAIIEYIEQELGKVDLKKKKKVDFGSGN